MSRRLMWLAVALTAMVFAVLPVSATGGGEGTAGSAQPVTLRFFVPYGGKGTSGVHDDPIMKELTRRTGVALDWEFNTTKEKYNAMLASGDLPDILMAWTEDIKPLIEGSNVIDMVPLLAQHGKDVQKEDPHRLLFSKMFLSEGRNKLFFLPTWGVGEDWKPIKAFVNGTGGIGLYIRWDMYKEIGYPPLKDDILDVIPILKQMQDKHPATADGKRIYGLSPWFGDWDLWNFTIYYQGYDNLFSEAPRFVDIDPRKGDLVTSQIGDTSSSLWKGARFYNEAFQAGVLDPGSLIQKYDQAVEKQNAGRVLLNPVPWSVAGSNGAFANAGHPEWGFMPLKFPDKITMSSNGYRSSYSDRWVQSITTKSKNPAKAMDLLNFVNSVEGMRLLLNGIQGVNWNVGSDRVPHLAPETLKFVQGVGSEQDIEASGLRGYTHLFGRSQDSWDYKYNCYAWFQYNEDPSKQMATATPYQKDYAAHFNVAYPDQVFEKTLPGNKQIFDGSFQQMIDQDPADIRQIDENLLNYLKVNMVQIITAKSDAEFDAMQQKIIQECRNMGYERAFAWHKQNYDAAKAKTAAFSKAIGKK